MTSPIYAGIGSRATPGPVLDAMTKMAAWLSRSGWTLATGGAKGADTAFAAGSDPARCTIYLPWSGYNRLRGEACHVLDPLRLAAAMEVAAGLHPAWNRCTPATRKLHARNVAILLGPSLDRPVDAVVCWTERSAVVGGTGMGLRIAEKHAIPVLNLGVLTPRAVCERLLAIGQNIAKEPASPPLPVSPDETDAPSP